MNIKNIIIYILLIILGFIIQIISYIIYPIVFFFRHRILKYASARIEQDEENQIFKLKPSVKKYKLYLSPLFWGFLFTTGLTDKYCGALWYKKEQKLKWFTKFEEVDGILYPIPITFKQKLQYFWLSYCWGGFRNAAWAFSEWFFREGKSPHETIKIYKCNMPDNNILPIRDIVIIPSAKFKDKDGTDRNNSGPYIRYAFDSDEKWLVTNEGVKILTFKTLIGKERFTYAKCKIYKCDIIKKFFVIELVYGWDNWDGMKIFHTKFMFKKMDEFSVNDYNKYLNYLLQK